MVIVYMPIKSNKKKQKQKKQRGRSIGKVLAGVALGSAPIIASLYGMYKYQNARMGAIKKQPLLGLLL